MQKSCGFLPNFAFRFGMIFLILCWTLKIYRTKDNLNGVALTEGKCNHAIKISVYLSVMNQLH